MSLRKLSYILLSIIITISSFGINESYAASKKSKARTSQTSGSKKSKKSKSSKNSNSSKRSGSKKKSKNSSNSSKSKKGKNRKKGNAARTYYKAPPKEQPQNDSLTLSVNSYLLSWMPAQMNPGGLRVNSVKPDKARRTATVNLNENFTYLPVTRNLIDSISQAVKGALPDSLADYRVTLNVGNRSLAYYIRHIDKLPEQYRKNTPFVTEVNPMVHPVKGMEGDIVALWHSHGRYFKSGSWQWQRPLLFQSIEDTYTMSYMLPFIVPMLENAGAYVMLPRERDTNRNEVIVDNDTNDEGQIYSQTTYKEQSGHSKWVTGEEEGFIYDLPDFRDTENPFENGTYRQTTTQRGGTPSVAAWYADIPEPGEYAVYVSYKTLPNSTSDARYTVNYSGGSKEFKVNQKMGGGTWIYLGTFPFEDGYSDTEPVVTLTNLTDGQAGTIVTADAIKIGGGMGNIARSSNRSDVYYDPSTPAKDEVAQNTEDTGDDEEDDESGDENDTESGDDITDTAELTAQNSTSAKPAEQPAKKGAAPRFSTSGMPRFLEGARYWLHWAGFPEYVYSPYHGRDDYKDDYTSRGHWVNYLAGGSRVLPDKEGLGIPVDAAFALHSDAGKRADDSIVGTLGIYFTQNGDSYADGTPRINSRMLTDMVMQQITADIRREYEPNWTRRSMWDKSYVEARVPEVPTTLIELMSHQNFGDMQYGLDPNFRFTVGRAIYKGIARFLAERKDRKLVIQPLPVKDFSIKRTKAGQYKLSWAPTKDPAEPTADPTKYIIMERSHPDLGFHKIGETKSTSYEIRATDHDIHSFYIIAANDGGMSFPSETLSFREGVSSEKPVMIVNGFTRVSGPSHFSADGRAGFESEVDFGVPYIKDIAYTGPQTEFRRSAGDGFGRSSQNYITKVIAGNTFDYPAIHGAALGADRGFVSASAGAVEKGDVKLDEYPIVDVIMGRQKRTVVGKGKSGVKYTAFPPELLKSLRHYVEKGGNLIISGEYMITDLTEMRSTADERKFAVEILGSEGGTTDNSKSGHLRDTRTGKTIDYSATLNERQYIVQQPDVLTPAEGTNAETFLTFTNGATAGQIVRHGKGKTAVMTVPFEALTNPDQQLSLMKQIENLLK